jgi:hypothetical protein
VREKPWRRGNSLKSEGHDGWKSGNGKMVPGGEVLKKGKEENGGRNQAVKGGEAARDGGAWL